MDQEGLVANKPDTLGNDYGDPDEKLEIKFIDGEDIDCTLAPAIGLNQYSFARFFEIVVEWEDWVKTVVILAVGECGCKFDHDCSLYDFEIDVCEVGCLRALPSDHRPSPGKPYRGCVQFE